jgi:hypothetical protein
MKSVFFTTGMALSRRSFLRGTGIGLALPWLDAMRPAFGAEPVAPKRFVGILNCLSLHTPHLFPRETGHDYAPTSYLAGIMHLRDAFTVISGLNHPEVRDGHASDKSFLSGAPHPGSPAFRNTISMDQLAATELGEKTRYPSLVLSTTGRASWVSYTNTGVAVPPDTSPARAFAKLFINGSPAEVAQEVARVEEGQSILDRVASEAKRLARSVGPRDGEKVDQYLTSVRELEKRLQRSRGYATQPKPKPAGAAPVDPGPGEDTRRFGLFLEVARLALQTDLTRVVTLTHGGTTKTPSQPDTKFAHHDLSHHGQDAGKIEKLAILERDLVLEWGGFLGSLRDTPDSGGRLLDHTMTVLGSALGNASSHDSTNLPILVGGGRFKHGQHLAYDPKDSPPLCNLWVQILQELGLETEKFATSKNTSLPGFEV